MPNLLQEYYFKYHHLNFPLRADSCVRQLTFQYGHFKEENMSYILKYINTRRRIVGSGQFFMQASGQLKNEVLKANWYFFFF